MGVHVPMNILLLREHRERLDYQNVQDLRRKTRLPNLDYRLGLEPSKIRFANERLDRFGIQ